jgi:hypothetical protein
MGEAEFIFPPGMPEEVQQFVQGIRTRWEMSQQDYQNRVRGLLDTLSPDDLVTLREILHNTSADDTQAPYLQGQITAILRYVHKVCISCGEIHEGDHLSALVDGPPSPKDEPKKEEQLVLPFTEEPTTSELVDQSVASTVEYDAKLEEYNLRRPEENEVLATPGEKPVICRGCGTLYQSLEDRMLRPASLTGCAGCVQKQKWG